MVVEDVGEVDFRGGFRRAAVERGGEVEHHRVGGLHIGGTAAPQHAVFGMSVGDFFANQRIAGLQPLWWEIVDDRHSIEVPGQDHTARLAEVGAGHHCVAVTADGQVLLLVKEGLDLVGEGALVVGHGEVLHDLGEQAVQLLGSGCGAVQFKRHVNSVPRGRRAQHTHYMRFCGRIHFYVPHWVAKGRIMPGLISAMQGFCVIGIVIAVGYVAARMRIGGPSAQMVLNRFSFFVSSPCLMFAILSKEPIFDIFHPSIIVAFFSAVLVGVVFLVLNRMFFT